jgi:uncharacterized SAM-binding protein YcdF (DUF218 family)
MLTHIIRELVLPPSSFLILVAVSWFLYKKEKARWGRAVLIFALTSLYLLSIPPVSLWLTRTTQTVPAMTVEQVRAFQPQAIVSLGGGANYNTVEFEGRTVPSSSTIKRLYYALFLARELGVPIVTTGGYGETEEDSEGYVAARYLKESGFENVLVESKSTNTRENAAFTWALAKEQDLQKVVVVTSAGHAARAEMNFRAVGFEVKAAPTGFRSRMPWERGVLMVIPSHSQFNASCGALREHMAYVWDWLRS